MVRRVARDPVARRLRDPHSSRPVLPQQAEPTVAGDDDRRRPARARAPILAGRRHARVPPAPVALPRDPDRDDPDVPRARRGREVLLLPARRVELRDARARGPPAGRASPAGLPVTAALAAAAAACGKTAAMIRFR